MGEKTGEDLTTAIQDLLRRQTGRNLEVVETRPSSGADGERTAYLVYVRP